MGPDWEWDIQQIARFRETGEVGLLNEWVHRHLPGVRAMIYAMVLNHADADDLTQEVFVRAVRGLGSFRGKSKFFTWLCAIAMNTTRSFLARKARSPVANEPLDPAVSAPGHARPDQRMMAGELDNRISTALAKLSPRLRAAIVLTILQDLSVAEAARIEGCNRATLYWRVHQARKKLRTMLEDVI